MTDFLTADTNLPSYMMFPRFLLDMEINETAKMLYIILLYGFYRKAISEPRSYHHQLGKTGSSCFPTTELRK